MTEEERRMLMEIARGRRDWVDRAQEGVDVVILVRVIAGAVIILLLMMGIMK